MNPQPPHSAGPMSAVVSPPMQQSTMGEYGEEGREEGGRVRLLGEREEIEKKRERRGRDWNNGGVCERGMKERKREEDGQRGKGRD